MGVTDDPILLKLVISGQSPSELEQLAQQTQGQLNAKTKVLLDQLTALHKGTLDAQNAAMVNEIQSEIKLKTQQLATVTKIADAQAATAKKLADDNIKELQRNFDFAMKLANMQEKQDAEELARKKAMAQEAADIAHKNAELQIQAFEAITVGAEAVFSIIERGAEKFKELGEQIVKNAQIYGSLKGSIDKLRETTHGEIADVDLITLKNRALAKDLELTDDQFADVAKQAKHFADTLGVDTKEAMDQLIDGLATGRTKMLAHAGVVVDTDAAYRRFADAHGLIVEKMTAEEKLLATQAEALTKIKEKTKEFGDEGVTVANLIEMAFAKTKNAITGTLAAIGNAKFGAPTDYGASELAAAQQDSIARGDPSIYQRALAAHNKALADRSAARARANQSEYTDEELAAQRDQLAGNYGATAKNSKAYTEDENAAATLSGRDTYGYYSKPVSTLTGADIQAAHRAMEEAARKAEEAQKKADAINEMMDKFWKKVGGLDKATLETGNDNYQQTADEKALGNTYDPGASRNALIGRNNAVARSQAYANAEAARQANIARSMEAPNESNDLSRGVDSKAAMDRMDKSLKSAQDRIDDLRKRSGDGVLSELIYGIGGPAGLQKQLETSEQMFANTMGMISQAGDKMAGALAQSLTAFVAGDKMKTSLRQQTHDILEALSTQAYTKAIMETAEGLAMTGLALFGNPAAAASASAHFAAAGMYAAVGTAAGLGARGVGNDSKAAAAKSGGASSGSGISTSNSGSGGFGSNGQRSSPAQNSQPLTINLNVMPGGEAEAGRQINKALSAYYSQTGQGVPAAMVAA